MITTDVPYGQQQQIVPHENQPTIHFQQRGSLARDLSGFRSS
jgi:hypothetical protein